MNRRHTAALALVGWYVMVPMVQKGKAAVSDTPSVSTGAKTSRSKRGRVHYIGFTARVDPNAPLSKWMMAHYGDSKRDCQAFLKNLKRLGKPPRGLDEKELAKWKQMNQRLAASAKCVASDDPGLKGNKHIRMFQRMTPQFRTRVFGRLDRQLEKG
jgi:hypothetical protein